MGRISGFLPLVVDTGTPQRLIVAEASEDFVETTPTIVTGLFWMRMFRPSTLRSPPSSRCQ